MSFAPPIPDTDVDQAPPARPWRLDWRGQSYAEGQLTGQHLSTLALLTGQDHYEALDLNPRAGHQRLMMVLTAFEVVRRVKLAADEADAEAIVAEVVADVAAAPAEEILAALRYD